MVQYWTLIFLITNFAMHKALFESIFFALFVILKTSVMEAPDLTRVKFTNTYVY